MKLQKKVMVWIVNRTDKEDLVLLFKVIAKRGGGWHPVTGSVDLHEHKSLDWLAAAKRETEEETGISSKLGEWVDLELSLQFDGRWGRAEEHAFAFILKNFKGEVTLDSSEHEAERWVTFDEAQKSVGFDFQRRALDAVSCYLPNA